MTKKDFLESYAECVQRIRLKEQQSEGKWIPDRLCAEIAELEARRQQVLAAIETARRPVARVILESRYINGLTFEQTARRVGYDPSNVSRILQKAMKEMVFPAGVV